MLTAARRGEGGGEGLDSLEVDVWVSEGSLGRGWDHRRFVGGVTPRLQGVGWGVGVVLGGCGGAGWVRISEASTQS